LSGGTSKSTPIADGGNNLFLANKVNLPNKRRCTAKRGADALKAMNGKGLGKKNQASAPDPTNLLPLKKLSCSCARILHFLGFISQEIPVKHPLSKKVTPRSTADRITDFACRLSAAGP